MSIHANNDQQRHLALAIGLALAITMTTGCGGGGGGGYGNVRSNPPPISTPPPPPPPSTPPPDGDNPWDYLDAAFAQAVALATLSRDSLTPTQQQFLASAAAVQHIDNLAQAVASIDSLSGQGYASTRNLLLNQFDRQPRQLMDHLDHMQTEQAHATNVPGMWFSSRAQDAIADAGNARVTQDGFVAGIDQLIGNNLIVGVAAGRGQARMDFDRLGGQARMQLPSAMVYARTWRGPWYATGQLDQTNATLSMQRWIDLGDGARHRADSDLNLDKFSAYLEGGRDFRVGRSHITPFAGLAYDALRSRAFVERGDTGFELAGQAANSARTAAEMGLRYRSDWHWGADRWAQLNLSGHYRHVLQTGNNDLRAAFVGAPLAQFDIAGLSPDRDARWMSLEFDLGRGANWSSFVRYNWSMVGADRNNAWGLGTEWKF